MRIPARIVMVAAAALFVGACRSQGPPPDGAPGSAAAPAAGAPIAAAQLAERIQAGTAPFILDVRTPQEFSSGHIPGAVNISHDELPGRLAELAEKKTEEVVVYCRSGRRARIAEDVLLKDGFTNVRYLTEQWLGWETAGLPKK